jgi:hypothetical protein
MVGLIKSVTITVMNLGYKFRVMNWVASKSVMFWKMLKLATKLQT